jgi:hypothetical protein
VGERVGLVDEEDAVERLANHAIRLERGRADPLSDEPCAVDLDQVTAPEEAHRAVHLREEPRDRGLPRSGIPEEDEVLARCHLGEATRLSQALHLEERHESVDLLLHRLEPDERVELRLELRERSRLRHGRARLRADPVELAREPLAFRSAGLAQALAEAPERAAGFLERVQRHARTVPTGAPAGASAPL